MDQKLIDAAQRTANVYARVANRVMGSNIPVPVPLTFDLCYRKPKSSGEASALMVISINHILYEHNVRYVLNDTIPHEIGHLVQFDKFDLKGASTPGHGPEWNAVMKKLGKKPHKHHQLDVTPAVDFYKQSKKAKRAAKRKPEND